MPLRGQAITSSETAAYFGMSSDPYPLRTAPRPLTRVLEIGPGSGEGTLQLLRSDPQLKVVCVEPASAPRAALAWRLRDAGPEALSRVTPLPWSLEEAVSGGSSGLAALGPFDAVFARHVLCELAEPERALFWASLARLMARHTVALIDTHIGPQSRQPIARRLAVEESIGDAVFSRWFSRSPSGEDEVVTRTEYEIRTFSGSLLHHEERTLRQQVVSQAEVMAEMETAGLRTSAAQGGWFVIEIGG